MKDDLSDPKQRFSDRVAHYVRYRPDYPSEVIDLLRREISLTSSWSVADVGSGTGLSSRLFLDHGNDVFAVEPNADMREAAERLHGGRPFFHSVDGSAEDTTLAAQTVDLVVAAQAFHWFDPAAARREFLRILRPGGWILLMWNRRRIDTSSFARTYEELLLRFGTDYERVRHENVQGTVIDAFFPAGYAYGTLENRQILTFESLEGRLLSASYVPGRGASAHDAMLAALRAIFDEHEEDGRVTLEYSVDLYFGRV